MVGVGVFMSMAVGDFFASLSVFGIVLNLLSYRLIC